MQFVWKIVGFTIIGGLIAFYIYVTQTPSLHSQCKGLSDQELSDCEYDAAQEDVHATYRDL